VPVFKRQVEPRVVRVGDKDTALVRLYESAWSQMQEGDKDAPRSELEEMKTSRNDNVVRARQTTSWVSKLAASAHSWPA